MRVLSADKLGVFLEQNPALGKLVCGEICHGTESQRAARKARDLTRRKGALDSMSLPGKLADCSDKDPAKCEIYIVEGDSCRRFCKDSTFKSHTGHFCL